MCIKVKNYMTFSIRSIKMNMSWCLDERSRLRKLPKILNGKSAFIHYFKARLSVLLQADGPHTHIHSRVIAKRVVNNTIIFLVTCCKNVMNVQGDTVQRRDEYFCFAFVRNCNADCVRILLSTRDMPVEYSCLCGRHVP